MATKKTPRKRTPKYTTTPTLVALIVNGKGKPQVVVGSRRVAAATEKGAKVVDSRKLYWSQIKHAVASKDGKGRFHLTSKREAAKKGFEVLS